MTTEEFQNLVLQHFQKVYEKLDSIEKRQTKLETTVETDIAEKIQILFEANQVQNERHEQVIDRLDLQDERHKQVMEKFDFVEKRLDNIEIDTGYLVSKVAKLETLAK